ncbi:hypothetical protein [Roseateles sp.]
MRRLDHLRVTVRWHLKQRRPRPAHVDTIDHLVSAAHNILAIALLIAIGG